MHTTQDIVPCKNRSGAGCQRDKSGAGACVGACKEVRSNKEITAGGTTFYYPTTVQVSSEI